MIAFQHMLVISLNCFVAQVERVGFLVRLFCNLLYVVQGAVGVHEWR